MKYNNIFDLIGNTPCLKLEIEELRGINLYVKLEGYNPTASIKDRAALFNIRSAINDGTLKKGKTILDASSGNMACSIAYFGYILGFPTEVICSSKLTNDKEKFIKYYSADLTKIGNYTIEGNRYCRDVLVKEYPDKYCFLDQLHNWNNPESHFVTTGPEILKEFKNPVAIVGSMGSGGTMNGIARFVKQKLPEVKIVTVESSPGTKLPGVGSFSDGDYITPFIIQMIELNLIDERIQVSYDNSYERNSILKRQGFYCGLQTAAVVEAAIQFSKMNNISGDVIAISGDAGWKNQDKL